MENQEDRGKRLEITREAHLKELKEEFDKMPVEKPGRLKQYCIMVGLWLLICVAWISATVVKDKLFLSAGVSAVLVMGIGSLVTDFVNRRNQGKHKKIRQKLVEEIYDLEQKITADKINNYMDAVHALDKKVDAEPKQDFPVAKVRQEDRLTAPVTGQPVIRKEGVTYYQLSMLYVEDDGVINTIAGDFEVRLDPTVITPVLTALYLNEDRHGEYDAVIRKGKYYGGIVRVGSMDDIDW